MCVQLVVLVWNVKLTCVTALLVMKVRSVVVMVPVQPQIHVRVIYNMEAHNAIFLRIVMVQYFMVYPILVIIMENVAIGILVIAIVDMVVPIVVIGNVLDYWTMTHRYAMVMGPV